MTYRAKKKNYLISNNSRILVNKYIDKNYETNCEFIFHPRMNRLKLKDNSSYIINK